MSFDTFCLKNHTAEPPFEQHEVSTSATVLSSSIWKDRAVFLLSIVLFLSLYLLHRAPTFNLGLAYYDDGETLYHAFATYQGLVPYRDNYNHHFLGYIIPFLITGLLTHDWMLNFAVVRCATILFSALFLFILVRRWTTTSLGLLAGLLLLSAREPWVLAFFQQYQINLFIIIGWGLLTQSLTRTRGSLLFWGLAGLTYGCAFVFDQRALLLISIPLLVIICRISVCLFTQGEPYGQQQCANKPRWRWKQHTSSVSDLLKELVVVCMGFCVPVIGCLVYLWSHDALTPWFQQTIYYPLVFRAAPLPFSEKLKTWYALYSHLPIQSPFLFVTGLCGLLTLLIKRVPPHLLTAKLLVASSLPALFLMPLLGGRDFDYYTITWFPALALTAALAMQLLREGTIMKKMHSVLVSAAILIPVLESISNLPSRLNHYSGDGLEEVVSYLQATGASGQSVYLWGYRLELYARLRQVSAFPFASRIFIHPDQQFPENREQRVYSLYLDRFLALLNSNPPQYLIWFTPEKSHELSSSAEDALTRLVQREYREVYTLTKNDFRGHPSSYRIYRRDEIPVPFR